MAVGLGRTALSPVGVRLARFIEGLSETVGKRRIRCRPWWICGIRTVSRCAVAASAERKVKHMSRDNKDLVGRAGHRDVENRRAGGGNQSRRGG